MIVRIPAPMVRKTAFLLCLLASLGGVLTSPALGAIRYSIDFEEPVHHLGQPPTLGAAPDKVGTIVFGSPTVQLNPSGLSNQALEMRAGTSYSQISLAVPSVLGTSYQLDLDVLTMEMQGSNYGFGILLDAPDTRSVTLNQALKEIDTFNSFVTEGTKTLPFVDGAYHITIQVDTVADLWVVNVNGTEICRQEFSSRPLSTIRFNVGPVIGNQPVSTAPHVFLDNVWLTDTSNTAPTFLKGPNLSIETSSGPQTFPGWATAISAGPGAEANQSMDFRVTSDNPALFSSAPALTPSGTLSFTPAAGAIGRAVVSVQLHDSGGIAAGGVDTSAPQTFVISVSDVKPPAIDRLPSLTVLEDSGLQTVALSGIQSQAAAGNRHLFVIADSSRPDLIPAPQVLYSSPDDHGSLTFQPIAGMNGKARITVTVYDRAAVDSTTTSFDVEVKPVNSAPSFLKGPDLSIRRDAGPQIFPGWASGISAGPPDEAGQILHFVVSTTHPEIFAAAPAVSGDGSLTFVPALGTVGSAIVSLQLVDSGPGSAPDVNTSPVQSFAIYLTNISSAKGQYSGLVRPSVSAGLEEPLTGLIRLAVARSGEFTGKLILGGKSSSLRGVFDDVGVAHFGAAKLTRTTVTLSTGVSVSLEFHINLGDGTYKLEGSLLLPGLTYAAIEGDRALFTKDDSLAPFQRMPVAMVGAYTVVIAPKSPAEQGMPTDRFPQGSGVGVLNVSKTGTASFAGTLADGSVFTYANFISLDGNWPFYVAMKGGGGSISGPVVFRDRTGLSDVDGLSLRWFKAANQGATYPAGWPTGIATDLLGSKYEAPGFPGLDAEDLDGNAQVTLGFPGVDSPLLKAINITVSRKLVIIQPGPDLLALKMQKEVGLMIGNFIPTGAKRSEKIHAAIFRKQGAAFGFFLHQGEAGSISIVPNAHPVSSP